MKAYLRLFVAGYFVISVLFLAGAVALICLAAAQLWEGVKPWAESGAVARLNSVLESIALLTVAVAALELGQTLVEEEVVREAHMSAPTRVRRFLSRFMVVLVVALTIETLVLVFRAGHEEPANLLYPAAVGITAAALLAAWGVFIRFNRAAEELEPEAMERTKREDERVE